MPAATLAGHVERFREARSARLAEYRAIEPTNTRAGADRFHWFELRRAIERAEQDVAWADWVLAELGAMSALLAACATVVVALVAAGHGRLCRTDAGRRRARPRRRVRALPSEPVRLDAEEHASAPRRPRSRRARRGSRDPSSSSG